MREKIDYALNYSFMEKYTVDYSETSYFKGIRIRFDHIEEAIEHIIEKKIKEVAIWNSTDNTRKAANFDFLEKISFVETFSFTVPLSKKSNVDGLYHLKGLKSFMWGVGNDFPIDLSQFHNLESINISHNKGIKGWSSLKSLKKLQMMGVNTADLQFVSGMDKLEYLRIIRGKFKSIKGVEGCKKLQTLFLQNCTLLEEVKPIVEALPDLKQLNLEKCKNIKDLESIKKLPVKHISVI